MLLEKLGKGRDGNIEGVGAIVLLEALDVSGAGDAPGALEGLELGLLVGVDEVDQGPEGLVFGVVEKSALLEEEGQIRLASDLRRGD